MSPPIAKFLGFFSQMGPVGSFAGGAFFGSTGAGAGFLDEGFAFGAIFQQATSRGLREESCGATGPMVTLGGVPSGAIQKSPSTAPVSSEARLRARRV